MKRRSFLQFLGIGTAGIAGAKAIAPENVLPESSLLEKPKPRSPKVVEVEPTSAEGVIAGSGVAVFLNGILQAENLDYTLSTSGEIKWVEPVDSGDWIRVWGRDGIK